MTTPTPTPTPNSKQAPAPIWLPRTEHSRASIEAQLAHERLRRSFDPTDENNARLRLEVAAHALEQVEALEPTDRRAALLEVLVPVVEEGRAKFAAFDGYVELLAEAETVAREATHRAAEARRLDELGSGERKQALKLHEDRVAAESADRFATEMLRRAQRPARLPAVGLPPEVNMAERDTETLVTLAEKYGIVFTSDSPMRPAVDVLELARVQGIQATPQVAVWWLLHEARALAALASEVASSATSRRTARHAAIDDDQGELTVQLEQLFAFRWQTYLETQALSPVERERRQAVQR